MGPNQIRSLINKPKQKDNTFLPFLKNNYKFIKKIVIILSIFICVLKPSVPAKITGNIVDAFITEYVDIKNKHIK